MAGPSGAGPDESDHTGPGVRIDLASAKDDYDSVVGSQTEHQPDNDALDDAAYDRIFLIHTAQRAGAVLDRIKCHGYRHPIFRYWMAAHIPAVPQT